jgi:hypothetical protein
LCLKTEIKKGLSLAFFFFGFVFERKEKKQERPIYAWLLID